MWARVEVADPLFPISIGVGLDPYRAAAAVHRELDPTTVVAFGPFRAFPPHVAAERGVLHPLDDVVHLGDGDDCGAARLHIQPRERQEPHAKTVLLAPKDGSEQCQIGNERDTSVHAHRGVHSVEINSRKVLRQGGKILRCGRTFPRLIRGLNAHRIFLHLEHICNLMLQTLS